jgi:hypothetical protein
MCSYDNSETDDEFKQFNLCWLWKVQFANGLCRRSLKTRSISPLIHTLSLLIKVCPVGDDQHLRIISNQWANGQTQNL